jgi:PhnB protein
VVSDAAWAQAVAAGAEVTMPLADQFWGDRYGQLRDSFGHNWSISQTKSAPTQEQIEQGAIAVFADQGRSGTLLAYWLDGITALESPVLWS